MAWTLRKNDDSVLRLAMDLEPSGKKSKDK